MLCRPVAPRCEECPLRDDCAYRGAGDDPAIGSAHVSVAQSRFEGSDRQGRGRLMKALGARAVRADALAATMHWPDQPERASRVAASLVVDGLAVYDESTATFHLPR